MNLFNFGNVLAADLDLSTMQGILLGYFSLIQLDSSSLFSNELTETKFALSSLFFSLIPKNDEPPKGRFLNSPPLGGNELGVNYSTALVAFFLLESHIKLS